jgi:hypothetical protein
MLRVNFWFMCSFWHFFDVCSKFCDFCSNPQLGYKLLPNTQLHGIKSLILTSESYLRVGLLSLFGKFKVLFYPLISLDSNKNRSKRTFLGPRYNRLEHSMLKEAPSLILLLFWFSLGSLNDFVHICHGNLNNSHNREKRRKTWRNKRKKS